MQKLTLMLVALGMTGSLAQGMTLYSGGSSAPSLFYANTTLVPPAYTGTGLQVATTNDSRAGWSNYNGLSGTMFTPGFPTLDRSSGFKADFTISLTSESHLSNDRAGFSIILLGQDARGIEIGFHGDEVFAQEGGTASLFTRAENFAINTLAVRGYSLQIVGSTYQLWATATGGTGDMTKILEGSVRDYSAWNSGGGVDPYEKSNYLFLGDNTTSAAGTFEMRSLSVAPVPEPTAIAFVGMLAGGLLLRRRK